MVINLSRSSTHVLNLESVLEVHSDSKFITESRLEAKLLGHRSVDLHWFNLLHSEGLCFM